MENTRGALAWSMKVALLPAGTSSPTARMSMATTNTLAQERHEVAYKQLTCQ